MRLKKSTPVSECGWYKREGGTRDLFCYTDPLKLTMDGKLVGAIISENSTTARYSNTIYPDVLKHEFVPCEQEEVLKYIISNSINVAGLVDQVDRRLNNGNQAS